MANLGKGEFGNGIVDSTKATNFKVSAAKEEAAKLVAAKKLTAPVGGKLYRAVADPNLRLQYEYGFINFIGGYYPTADKIKMQAIDRMVDMGYVVEVEAQPEVE